MPTINGDMVNILEQFVAASRNLAIAKHNAVVKEHEFEQAKKDVEACEERRDALLSRIDEKAKTLAGLGSEDAPAARAEFFPVMR